MTKYMLILGGADLDKRGHTIGAAMFERYATWMRSLRENDHYVSSDKLHDQTGARLTVRGGQVVEGPFIETKEAVGGYVIVQAQSLEEATRLGRDCPVLDMQNGYVEVRVIEEMKNPR